MAVVALALVGFCKVEVNELGPAHEYVLPPLDDKLIVEPTHSVSPVAVATGMVFTTTFAVAVAVQPALLVTVTV